MLKRIIDKITFNDSTWIMIVSIQILRLFFFGFDFINYNDFSAELQMMARVEMVTWLSFLITHLYILFASQLVNKRERLQRIIAIIALPSLFYWFSFSELIIKSGTYTSIGYPIADMIIFGIYFIHILIISEKLAYEKRK
jgi:hypothetical protein